MRGETLRHYGRVIGDESRKEIKMVEDRAVNEEQQPAVEKGPTEKLQDDHKPVSQIPGAENPESEEIKQEVNPNTE